ncbi:MAG: primosomal protein N' [Nitrospiraceae bacterium]|nr:primosomal protein N' [Nitrospiraceae bacterium]
MSNVNLSSADESSVLSVDLPITADVIVPRHLTRPFTYAVPPRLRPRLSIGSRVLVPFGPTTLQGIVVSLATQLPDDARRTHAVSGRITADRLRDIIAQLDETPETGLPADLITLSHLVSDYYVAPLGQCLRLILPVTPSLKNAPRYVLTDLGHAAIGPSKSGQRLSATYRMILSRLAGAPKGLSYATLNRTIPGSDKRVLAALKRKQLVQERICVVEKRPVRPKSASAVSLMPADDASFAHGASSPVSGHASAWIHRVHAAMAEGRYTRVLVPIPFRESMDDLMQAVEKAFSHRRTVLVITPEIAEAEALAVQFKSRWNDRVELFHGSLPARTRADVWSRVRRGQARLVVGTRSAIFSPLPTLGLICVEDEHDPSLKEESEPRYHAREVASMRAHLHGAVLLLASAHPSLEALHVVHEQSVFDCTAGNRDGCSAINFQQSPSAHIKTIDLRRQPYGTFLSDAMIDGVARALAAHTGAILFLNRKGFAPALVCRDCGKSPQCPQCSIALTFYRQAGHLSCSYCGTRKPLPDACPFCLAAKLEPVGVGTERIEALVRREFPDAKIARLDRAVPRSQAEAIRRLFISGDIDLLIGTQMLLQGTPLPRAGFVGLILADAGLHLPDFRAGERAYHTLRDAVAMARPQAAGGHVVAQTYLPDHHVIAAVTKQEPAIFYDQELMFRRMLGYPPFSHVIGLRVTGSHEALVVQAAERWAIYLKTALKESVSSKAVRAAISSSSHDAAVLGPVPSAVAKLRGRYRWQLLVKSFCAETARTAVRTTLEAFESLRGQGGLKYEVDVDPITLM